MTTISPDLTTVGWTSTDLSRFDVASQPYNPPTQKILFRALAPTDLTLPPVDTNLLQLGVSQAAAPKLYSTSDPSVLAAASDLSYTQAPQRVIGQTGAIQSVIINPIVARDPQGLPVYGGIQVFRDVTPFSSNLSGDVGRLGIPIPEWLNK